MLQRENVELDFPLFSFITAAGIYLILPLGLWRLQVIHIEIEEKPREPRPGV